MPGSVAGLALPALYLLGWLVNLLCVVLALGSMELFLPALRRLIAEP